MKPIKLTARESNMRQKAVADEIARLVGGKAGKNTIHVQGEPPSGYRVTLHRYPFWFRARISDNEFVFVADHQRGAGEKDFFQVDLFKPWQTVWPQLRLRVAHQSLTKKLGVKIYIAKPYPLSLFKRECWDELKDQPSVAQRKVVATAVLGRAEFRRFFSRLRNEHYRRFLLCDTQMMVIGSIGSPEEAARRILLLRDMMETTYRVSRKLLAKKSTAPA
jgi:hypothetical protein